MAVERIGSLPSETPNQKQRRFGDIIVGNEFVWGEGSSVNVSQLFREVRAYWESKYSDGQPTPLFTLARRAWRAARLQDHLSQN